MAQTDNSFLADKVKLRFYNLPGDKDTIRVLDCFGGRGLVWAGVQALTDKDILRLSIDLNRGGFALPGDNRIYLESLDLSRFDVIDLDAYGVPYHQLKSVLGSTFQGVVFVTFIQNIHGILPCGLLEDIGFTAEMIKKCPTVFGQLGWQYFLEWLAAYGVRTVRHRSHYRKHYLTFNYTGEPVAGSHTLKANTFAGLS